MRAGTPASSASSVRTSGPKPASSSVSTSWPARACATGTSSGPGPRRALMFFRISAISGSSTPPSLCDQAEAGDEVLQLGRRALQALGRRRDLARRRARLLGRGRDLLARRGRELGDARDLAQLGLERLGARRDLARGGRDLGDALVHLADRGADAIERVARLLDGARALLGARGPVGDDAHDPARLVLDLADQALDLARGPAGVLGEATDLVGDDREAAAVLAGAGGLDRRVEREQVRLLGDLGDALDDRADLARLALECGHGLGGGGGGVAHGGHRGGGLEHGGDALARQLTRLGGGAGRLAGGLGGRVDGLGPLAGGAALASRP